MPTSDIRMLNDIIEWILEIQPESVLDVGTGFGRYGFVCREILDVYKGRYDKSEWKTLIFGVEVNPDYITPIHEYIYDEIFSMDIRKIKALGDFDLIILGDVIEHLPKKEGLDLIKKLLKKCKHMIIQTPYGYMPQISEISSENHLCGYYPEELNNFHPKIKLSSNIFIALIRGEL